VGVLVLVRPPRPEPSGAALAAAAVLAVSFQTFQGSNLPYWLLLSFQLVILFIMVRLVWRMQRGALVPVFRTGKVLLWTGCIYMIVSLGRIIVGAILPDAPAWFSTWIPAAFHLVLAAFVLTLGFFHHREFRKLRVESQ
jgi:hypothetical protein